MFPSGWRSYQAVTDSLSPTPMAITTIPYQWKCHATGTGLIFCLHFVMLNLKYNKTILIYSILRYWKYPSLVDFMANNRVNPGKVQSHRRPTQSERFGCTWRAWSIVVCYEFYFNNDESVHRRLSIGRQSRRFCTQVQVRDTFIDSERYRKYTIIHDVTIGYDTCQERRTPSQLSRERVMLSHPVTSTSTQLFSDYCLDNNYFKRQLSHPVLLFSKV